MADADSAIGRVLTLEGMSAKMWVKLMIGAIVVALIIFLAARAANALGPKILSGVKRGTDSAKGLVSGATTSAANGGNDPSTAGI